jgi:hypothetical protein
METKKCLIVLVGHHPDRLKLTIDKEIMSKLILIREKEKLSGSEKQVEAINNLINYYEEQLIETQIRKFSFTEQTKAVAELVYLILEQKYLGFKSIAVNISGGLRYMVVWFYIACLITDTDIIHGDFKYKGDMEVGITYNMNLARIPFIEPTDKQYEFLELFFTSFEEIMKCIENQKPFDTILEHIKVYDSIESLKDRYNQQINKGKDITRGSINGYLNKLKKISAIETTINPENKLEKKIEITYLGISFVLNYIYNKYMK